MGKQRRQRQKLHLPAKDKSEVNDDQLEEGMDTLPSQPILMQPSENLFAGIDINFDHLKKDLLDDVRSVKSFKSLKSEVGGNKAMLKKDKIKLRRNMLLKKIDLLHEVKLKNKQRKKRKNISIIGDTNPLHDALPSLESLLKEKSTRVDNKKEDGSKKRKGIEKARKRKKQLVQGVQMMKNVLNNKNFQKDPLKMISQQVKTVVDRSKLQ
ncbi:hypothetical protein ILUMI_23016 [Ignelater luminosus]|uniref:Uncharacterized protein n=1 Tax=Ignelater luminosus TaxID=2038154 RepID=A0A8K0C9J7_IGNLU|nr:hypothetical protein ILUMI_23016 [Ignelater luminosus]